MLCRVGTLLSSSTATGEGAAAPSLADLFSGGYVGDYWDATDTATLKQNSNGTTDVASNGDPVGYWAGKRGSLTLTQASGTLRPLYVSSGTYVQPDGVDDFLESAALFTGYPLTLVMAFDKNFSNTGTPALSSAVPAVNVYRYMAASPSNGVCADRNVANVGSSPSLGYTTSAALQSMFAVFETGGAKALYVEGTESTLVNTNVHALAEKLLLGKFRDAGGFGSMKVRHLLAINRALDATQRAFVRAQWGAL